MKRINKFIAISLCFLILITGFNFTSIEVNAATTTVDLTGLSAGTETSHDCSKYLTTKYDSFQHWQECTVCGKVYGNKTNHTYINSGWTMGDSCSINNQLLKTCSCGYSYYSNNTRSHSSGFWFNNNSCHNWACSKCYQVIGVSGPHKNSAGQILGCKTGIAGTCATCGQYVGTGHSGHFSYSEQTNSFVGYVGCFNNCGFNGINFTPSTCFISHNGNYFTVKTTIYTNYSSTAVNSCNFQHSYVGVIDSCSSSSNGYSVTYTINGHFNSGYDTGYYNIYVPISFNGAGYTYYISIKPENTAPAINNILQTDISTSNDWSTAKQITISGTENYCGSVKLTMKDSSGIVYLNNISVGVSNNAWSYSFIPDIEADANGKTFTVTATDTLGNSSSKTFTVYKTDKKPPTMTSSTETSQTWSKTKDFTFTATDTGSGSVQIAFNNMNDYKTATQSGTSYSRDYTFTGDVYGNVTAAVYFKDAVGNETTKFIKVYNLDNTKPTITNASVTAGKGTASITVTANDINTTLNASGSGVSGYGISTSASTQPTSWQTSNVLSVTDNGTYYVWVKDAVGNVSSAKAVNVTELAASYKVYHQQEQLDGSYITKDTENLTGNIGTSVTPAVKSYTGFTSPEAQTVTIAADGSTVVNYYYTRNSYPVTYIDVVDSISGTVLKTHEPVYKLYESTVKGSDLGSSTADNAYYNGYYYVSDTSDTVGTSGATVYRIFKLRTLDISGTVSWTDNSNKWGTRPNSMEVYLYRDGEHIDTTTGLVNSESNEYSFKNLPKYSTSDGHVYNYTVSQSEAVSKTSPEDKYTTTQNTYDFINVLSNTDTDTDSKGLTVSGSIYWEDNGNSLGYRPSTVTITLYQNGEEYKTVEVDTFNNNTYEFIKLPKYDNDLNKYEYTVEETVIANYLVKENGNYVLKDAYTVKADTPNPLDFTNVFNIPSEPPIPVKPEYTNTVTIKTNTEDKIAISLKGMEAIINDDLSVSYGTSYNGQVYNVSANNIGEVLSSIGSGKYEISYYNTAYILNDITCTGDSNIWIEGNGDTYYLVIKDTNSNISGTITLDFSKKNHVGYQSDVSVSNYFKVKIETETSTALETQVFALSRITVTAEDIYSVIYENSDTIDDNIYNEGDEVEVLDYKGKVPEGTEFIGWSLTEDSEEPNYQVGDVITIENKDISLYPVFKEIEEFTETKTTEVRETETSDTKDSEATGESSKEETSQEESILKEESFQIEEISTENISSTEESIVEEESSETSESSEIEE